MALRQATVSSPAEVGWRLDRLRRRAEAMGLLEREDDFTAGLAAGESAERSELDTAVRRVLEALRKAGIARSVRRASSSSSSRASAARLARQLDTVWEAVEDSPVPQPEIRELAALLDWDPLSRYVGASTQSLRRYAAGQRVTPDLVAQRVHWLTGVVADLRAAYNEAGVRRWFERPRPSFDDRSPADSLAKAWTPDDARIKRIRDFAARLAEPTDAT